MVDKSETFSWLVRLGYAARGLTYLLLGWLALNTQAKATAGGQAVFDTLQKVPLGTAVLFVVTAGLAAYAAFKLLSAVFDVQHRGTRAKAIVKRIGDAASCVGYGYLAYAALQFASGSKHGVTGGHSRQTAHTVLDWTLGPVIVGLVGLGFAVAAVMQAKDAITVGFMKRVSPRAPTAVSAVGRAGYAARAVVFAIIAWSLVRSAWFDSSTQVKGLGDALTSLRASGAIYVIVAVGLMLFGAFSLVVARYRIIPDVGKEDLRPALG